MKLRGIISSGAKLLHCITISAVCFVPSALADDTGAQIYAYSCAICHGIQGDGAGPYGEFLKVNPPGLTELSKANGGKFPMDYVLSVIDGRAGIRAHGSDMPIWGPAFETKMEEKMGEEAGQVRARGLMLSVAYYLRSIQK